MLSRGNARLNRVLRHHDASRKSTPVISWTQFIERSVWCCVLVSSTRPSSRRVVLSTRAGLVMQVSDLSWWTGSSDANADDWKQLTIDLPANVALDDWSRQTSVDRRRTRAPWSRWMRAVHGTNSARCHLDATQNTTWMNYLQSLAAIHCLVVILPLRRHPETIKNLELKYKLMWQTLVSVKL